MLCYPSLKHFQSKFENHNEFVGFMMMMMMMIVYVLCDSTWIFVLLAKANTPLYHNLNKNVAHPLELVMIHAWELFLVPYADCCVSVENPLLTC
jgi:hypothetical protein